MAVRRVVAGAVLVAAVVLVWVLRGGTDSPKPAAPTTHAIHRGSAVAPHSQTRGTAGARRIAGTVLFDDGVAPPATVRLVSSLSHGELASTRTDASGHFDFGPVLPFEYIVAAEAAGATGAVARVDLRNPTVEPDALRLRLHGCQASIFGVVSDASGGTIANARLEVALGGPEPGPGVESQADGSYELCVPVGDAAVTVRADGYADTSLLFTASGRVRHDVAMSPEAIVAGRVVRADDGTAVPDAKLTIMAEGFARGSMILWHQGISAADGTFRLRGIAPGRYTMIATAEGLASEDETPVVTEVEMPADDVVLQLQPSLSLHGKVVDRQTKTPIAGATVTAWSTRHFDMRPRQGQAVTQSDGSFVIEGLAPGDYTARVADYNMPSGSSKLTVPSTQPVTLEVDRLASIAGRVTRNGKPVDGARVMAQRAVTTSDVDGKFVLRGLEAGDYHVYAESRRVGAFTKGPAVTVAAGEQKTGVEVELDLAGSIAGTVIDQNGAPVSGVLVRFSLMHGSDFGDATTAADGTFLVTALSGGGDYIYAVYEGKRSSIAYRPAAGKRFPPVSLENADTHRTGLRIQIQYDRLSISGRVLTSDGKPAPDVAVSAAQGKYDWSAPRATTDMAGRFTIKDLLAGQYEIKASSPHGEQIVPDVAAGTKNVEIRFPSVGTIVGTLEGFARPPRVIAYGTMAPSGYHGTIKGTSLTIANVPVGEYTVIANAKDGFARATVMVTAGANASVVLKNDGVGIVEGHVIDGSTRKPVTGLMCSCMGATATARTDDSGAFRIEGAPAGETSVYCVGPRATGHTETVVATGKTAQVEVVATARDRSRRSYSGLQLGQQLDHIVVTAVAEGSPAERAGIKVEDFLLRLDGEKVPDARTARMMLEYVAPGKSVQLTIERDDKERTVTLELAAPP